jgi:uncharacterized protein YdeI (YjbR/CyaY-like superfamily)
MDDEVYAKDRAVWRAWLRNHHASRDAVWLVYYKNDSGQASINYGDAVEEALCFGWVDSKVQAVDEDRYRQYFSVRKPDSTWSRSNKERVARLTKSGLMEGPGLRAVEVAKENGSWEFLDDIEEGVVPDDLAEALAARKGAREHFDGSSPSLRRAMLFWVKSAKRPATRQKRIGEIATAAAKGEKPKPFS